MGKKILFSAIGGNDPVSSATERDGSMLHICRIYQPDEVYLYLSKEMVDRHRQDNRYVYCIEHLGELIEHKFDVHCIEREDLIEVQEYDYYYEDFKEILKKIEKEMDEDDVLLVNIASGTPAMKSALLFLATIAEYKILPIQVKTPAKEINKHNGKDLDYDVEYYWEVNKDNEPDADNRCHETKCPNLVTILKKNIIEKHVNAYDYAAALRLAKEIRADISDECYLLLEAAVYRMQLDFSKILQVSKNMGIDFLPVQNSKNSIFEYALTLKIKMIRKEYGDFIRAISPLISDLFEMIAKEQCKINIHDYCRKRKSGWCWSKNELNKSDKGKEILLVLDNEFSSMGGLKENTPVAASNIKPILVHYLNDNILIQKIETMRDVEAKVRNIAAHEIVSITDDKLKRLLNTTMTINQIFNLIKNLVSAAKISVKEEDWNTYDYMNEIIIKELNK